LKPRLALTLGDPRGIGPEIVARALEVPLNADIVLVGAEDQISGLPASEKVSVGAWRSGSGEEPGRVRGKAHSRAVLAGTIAGRAVETAAHMALAGEVDGIVTAPVHKYALHLAGFPYPGHTEWLAHMAGDVDVAMMLAADRLRVVLITTHVA
jgi:4-hydroxy-L-threonine phosphate dehydrogenase PdxA